MQHAQKYLRNSAITLITVATLGCTSPQSSSNDWLTLAQNDILASYDAACRNIIENSTNFVQQGTLSGREIALISNPGCENGEFGGNAGSFYSVAMRDGDGYKTVGNLLAYSIKISGDYILTEEHHFHCDAQYDTVCNLRYKLAGDRLIKV